MDKYYLRAVRIAAKTKLADRWTHSQWYQPLDAEDAGTTFVLIEVVNPWFPAPQITTTITNTFNREYFRQRRVSSATDSFEVAVRRVNESLAARAEEGETDWIGNLHAMLAVVAGTELHFVQTGNALAYIYRDGLASSVAEPRPTDEPPTPLHTFVNIVTGSLEPGDKGIFATPDLLNYLSPEQLGTALSQPVEAAAKEIVKELQQQRVKTPHAVLFDYAATPHAERSPNESETIFVDVPLVGSFARARHAAKQVVLPALSSGVKATGSAASWFWGKTRNDFFPKVRSGLTSFARRGKEGVTSAAQKVTPVVSNVAQKTQDRLSDVVMQAETADKQSLVTKPAGLVAGLLNRLSALAGSVKLRSRLLFVALTLVVLAVIGIRLVTIQRQRESRVAQEAAQESLTAAQTKKQEADLALIYKETEKAIGLYVEALDLAKKAKEYPGIVQAAEEVIAGAQQSLDSLTATERISRADPYAQFTTDPVKFVVVDKTPWTVDGNGTVLAAPASGQKVAEQKTSSLGSIMGLGFITDHQSLYVIGAEGIGRVVVSDSSASLLTAPDGGWQPAIAVDSFGTTLYFLDKKSGQIWKYATSADGISPSPPSTYFVDTQPLTEAVDLAIDGNIYVLFADGTINRYFKGVQESFTVTGLPKPNEKLEKPTLIAADAQATGVYVYDSANKRVVEVDKQGAYKRQFALPSDWDVKDMQVSGAAKKLWVLVGKDVYEIE